MLSFVLLAAGAFAQKPADQLMDFTFPVPANFTATAAEGLRTRGKDVAECIMEQGILFPKGAKVEKAGKK